MQPPQLNKISIDTLLNDAVTHHQHNRLDEAICLYQEALTIEPNNINALHLIGVAHFHQDNIEQAAIFLEQAYQQHPNFPDAYHHYGIVLQRLNQYDKALHCFEQAICLNPNVADYYVIEGNTLFTLTRYADAAQSFRHAITIDPMNAAAFTGWGDAVRELGDSQEAVRIYQDGLKIAPSEPNLLFNYASLLFHLHAYEQSLSVYDIFLTLVPDSARGLLSYATALRELGRYQEALTYYDQALIFDSDNKEIFLFQSACHLLLGHFKQGWEKYEYRWVAPDVNWRGEKFTQPIWLGEYSIDQKTILLVSEQGLGDMIQFSRYVKQVAKLGARVILMVPPPLKKIMHTLEGTSVVISTEDTPPDFDYQCPLLSLPMIFQTELSSIPATTPYLFCEDILINKWAHKINKYKYPRIGITWSGSTTFGRDNHRSIALEKFLPFTFLPVNFFCLQPTIRATDQFCFDAFNNFYFFGDEITDFSDTAALVNHLDLVISVDTSIAHLTGALDKPVWILLPSNPDWRWLLERNDSPWYPTARLFRQTKIDDWDGVIQSVADALKKTFALSM